MRTGHFPTAGCTGGGCRTFLRPRTKHQSVTGRARRHQWYPAPPSGGGHVVGCRIVSVAHGGSPIVIESYMLNGGTAPATEAPASKPSGSRLSWSESSPPRERIGQQEFPILGQYRGCTWPILELSLARHWGTPPIALSYLLLDENEAS